MFSLHCVFVFALFIMYYSELKFLSENCSYFFQKHAARRICDSKLPLNMNLWSWCSALDRYPVQGVFLPCTCCSQERLQIHQDV